MNSDKIRLYKSLLPKNGDKLLVNQIDEEKVLEYRRIDSKKGSKKKNKTLSMVIAEKKVPRLSSNLIRPTSESI